MLQVLALRVVLQRCKERGVPVDTADEHASVLQQHTMFAVSDFYYLATCLDLLKLERGEISRVTQNGVITKCGKQLDADMVRTVTQPLQRAPHS